MSSKTVEKLSAVVALCLIILAWVAGGLRSEGASLKRIQNISSEIVNVTQVRPNVYEGHRAGNPKDVLYIGLATHSSYGGPLQVAVVVNNDEVIERVALVDTTDTTTYISRVLSKGVLSAFLGSPAGELPHVDAVSGATLSSTAITKGVERAVTHIRGSTPVESNTPVPLEELFRLGFITVLFIAAAFVSSKFFRWKKKYARLSLLGIATIFLGFLWGMQPSLSTVVMFLTGVWFKGLASYTALGCLILALVVFLCTRKNIYCAMICPFGGIQEGLGRITNCPGPKKTVWMKWTSRVFALAAVCVALYFRSPSDAEYAPFGIAFSFIGSTLIFALAIIIVVASLFVRRPWCTLLCPAGPVFDYLAFMRRWLLPTKKNQEKTDAS